MGWGGVTLAVSAAVAAILDLDLLDLDAFVGVGSATAGRFALWLRVASSIVISNG